jgi:hypothetical protein
VSAVGDRKKDDEEWERFLRRIRGNFGDGLWTSRLVVGEVGDLYWRVDAALQRRGVDGAARTLGKLLAARRGWWGDLLLESRGDGSTALSWVVRTLDEVLAEESGVP